MSRSLKVTIAVRGKRRQVSFSWTDSDTVKTTREDCAGFRVARSVKRLRYGLEDRETYQNIRCHKSNDKNLWRHKFLTLKRVYNEENLIFSNRISQEYDHKETATINTTLKLNPIKMSSCNRGVLGRGGGWRQYKKHLSSLWPRPLCSKRWFLPYICMFLKIKCRITGSVNYI